MAEPELEYLALQHQRQPMLSARQLIEDEADRAALLHLGIDPNTIDYGNHVAQPGGDEEDGEENQELACCLAAAAGQQGQRAAERQRPQKQPAEHAAGAAEAEAGRSGSSPVPPDSPAPGQPASDAARTQVPGTTCLRAAGAATPSQQLAAALEQLRLTQAQLAALQLHLQQAQGALLLLQQQQQQQATAAALQQRHQDKQPDTEEDGAATNASLSHRQEPGMPQMFAEMAEFAIRWHI